ncbi:MAG: hypothetical protein LBJ01_10510, partial [Tannerella sp.]|nr:hypothetical protein [Tannerella sp.]
NIILDATRISAMTVSATASLVSEPLKALTYTKCLKGGPLIVAATTGEVKAGATSRKEQMRQLREIYGGRQEGSDRYTCRLPFEGELPEGAEVIAAGDVAAYISAAAAEGEADDVTLEELEKILSEEPPA